MSILYKNDNGWVISHEDFFKNLQTVEGGSSYKLNPNLFNIVNPFKVEKQTRKSNKIEKVDISKTAEIVQNLSKDILTEYFNKVNFGEDLDKNIDKIDNKINNLEARNCANEFYKNISKINWTNFNGENRQDQSIIREISSLKNSFLFPPNTTFFSNDINNILNVLDENKKFKFILMDPPWRNKYIRRRKRKQEEAGYSLMENCKISDIPIEKISSVPSIIAVWITNCESHQQNLISEIFPKWGFKYFSTWYWIKVTKMGVPVTYYAPENGKQPYETIIIGIKENSNNQEMYEKTKSKSKVIVSVPSSIHSHKPPLIEVFKDYFPEILNNDDNENAILKTGQNSNIEIFARYLTTNFTSYGNEVIKLQHESLFVSQ